MNNPARRVDMLPGLCRMPLPCALQSALCWMPGGRVLHLNHNKG